MSIDRFRPDLQNAFVAFQPPPSIKGVAKARVNWHALEHALSGVRSSCHVSTRAVRELR